jgi:hypothetical protein
VTTAFGATDGSAGRAQQGLRVLDEAVRLLDLLQAQHPRPGSASATDADGDPPHRAGECQLCPVCRGLAALREANPEAIARMSRAVSELAAAIGDFVAGPPRAQPGAPATAPDPPVAARVTVQRIDVTE